MTGLAAQEYGLGVKNGQVIASAEVEEASLFLNEARRTAGLLPGEAARSVTAQLDTMLAMVARLAPPDSVVVRAGALSSSLAERFGVEMNEIPAQTPSLARGSAVYQANCASCHGTLGAGDGPQAAVLDPPPADLTAAAGLAGVSPLDYYHRITIGVAGTAMPAFETRLPAEDRWAAALYASLLRLPAPRGDVPAALLPFSTTARMTDSQLVEALGVGGTDSALAAVAAVRSAQTVPDGDREVEAVFVKVRTQLDSAFSLARAGHGDLASSAAFDAYMTFEAVEPRIRAVNAGLVGELEAGFASFRTRAAGGATADELRAINLRLAADLEKAERTIGEPLSGFNLMSQSFVIMLREGLVAILIIGALVAMLVKMGAGHRRRDVHIGVGAAILASLLTAVVLETLIEITPARREALEGLTMVVATVVLFYVSYWLLSKMEVAKWNRFVKGKVQDALTSGSALALASVAFLAVYREGFETVLFYKALFVAGGTGTAAVPVVSGMLAGGVVLAVVYVAINRFGVRLPLKPFFGLTGGFLYYMAFVFAGQGIAELQEGGLVSLTIVPGGPRAPALGIYPTVESLAVQGVMVVLLAAALVWTFVIEPRRRRAEPARPEAAVPVPEAIAGSSVEVRDMIRSLERMDADLAELRSEVERLKTLLVKHETIRH
jgi:high-affinity iron transporter